MKYNYTTVKIDSNLAFMDSANFEIGDHHKLLELAFKDLYNFKIRTCVQEYVSNAIDAHVSSKVSLNKIFIESPTPKSLFFKVKDNGPGLSKEELKDFIRAGISGSSDNDDNIGGFGFGSKIGFAVSNVFYVISINNGYKYTCEATRKTDDGSYAKLNFVTIEKTNESSGLEIIIPVQRDEIDEWEEGIQRICRHLDVKPVVSNLKLNKEEFILDDEDFKYFNNDRKKIYITLGCVEYPLDQLEVKKEVLDLFPNIELCLKLPISAFKPQRSREFLQSNEKVNKIILEKAKKVRNKIDLLYLDKLSKMTYEEIKEDLHYNPFIKKYKKKINDFEIKINRYGIISFKINDEYLKYFHGYNYVNGKSTSFANSRFSKYDHYLDTIVIDDLPEEKERIKRMKMHQNRKNNVDWMTNSYSNNYKIWNVLAITDHKFSKSEIKKLKNFLGEESLQLISELNYTKPESKSRKSIRDREYFSCTYSNFYGEQLLGNIDVKKTIYITREEWFTDFLSGRKRDDFARYASDLNLTYFVLSKNVVPKFEKLGVKRIGLNEIKEYFLTHYKDNSYFYAMLNLYDVDVRFSNVDCYSYDFESLYKIEKFLPKNLQEYLKDHKKVNRDQNRVYSHSFTSLEKEARKIEKQVLKEFRSFIKRNRTIFELYYNAESSMHKYLKKKDPIVLKMLKSLK